ncbi:RING finger protein 17-like isoform X2 [Ornithodoros turicata]|uniref:RING finger protein 17-like isoform X2 n=1 Tax=Ornithodoros turicata TaxID=34597 RepID=UPI003139FB43
MNRIEYSLKCPSCSQQYSNKEYRGSRTPRILQCGHTCCEVCIKSRSAQTGVCVCPVCKASQPVPDPNRIKDLLVDSYILGSQLQFGKELPDWFKYKNGEAFYTVAKPASSSKEESRKVPCDECGEQSASCRCDTCPSNYCKICFEQVHRIGKTMRRHKPQPLPRNSVPSPQDMLCEEHQRTLEFYCQEDNVLICSFCVVMGGHRPHTVVAVADQNKAAMEEIKPALEEGLRSFQGLKKTEKKLEKIRFGIDSYFQMAADNVMTHFHHLHGLLQLRCWQLLEEIKKANAEYARDLQEQGKDISSSLQEFLRLQKEATSLLSSSTPGNAAFVLEKLKRYKDMPCFLTSDPKSYRPIEQMQFDPALPGALKCYGDVQFAMLEKLNIVPLRDLPEDYIAGEGDDTDTESSSSYYENNTTEDSSQVSASQTSEDNGHVAESHDTLNNKRVVVSHIRDPCHFYVQLCHMVSKLRKMQKDINDYCVSPGSKLSSYEDAIQVGSIYLAQFGMDNNWYRCRVLRTQPSTVDIVDATSLQQGKNLVEVFYYDYGNSEAIPPTRLRLMQPEFKALPPMAIKCSLYNLVPSQGERTWRKSAIGMFARLTVNKNLILKEVERLPETLFVDLMDADYDDWTSVSDALVFSEMASYHLPDNRRQTRHSSVPRRQYYPPTEFHVGQVLSVLVSAVKSPHELYIQECGSNLAYLEKMSTDLQVHCETKKSEGESIYLPQVGMVCLAYNSRDQRWYRARVLGLPGGTRVDVCFVDYGSRETVRASCIRRIPDQFMKLPPQAIPVSMADVQPVENDTWSKEAKNRLTKLTINQELCMKVHASNPDRLPSVSLYIPGKRDKDICVNSILVKEKLASCTGPISLLVDVPNVMPRKAAPEKISLVHVQRAACKAAVQPKMDPRPEQQQQGRSSTGRLTAANALLAAVARQSTSPCTSPIPQPLPQPSPAPKGPGEGFTAVLITLVHSPASFFVRHRSDKDKWRKLVAKTQETLSTTSVPEDKEIQWQSDQWCAVDHNGLWHRAKVVAVADNVEVHLVDTGDDVTLPKESLAPIPASLTEQPPFAHKCHLAEIIPAGGSSNWSKTSMEFFEELVHKADGMYIRKMGEVLNDSQPVDLLLEYVKAAEALEPMKRTYKSVRETLKEHGYAFFPKAASRVKTPMISPTTVTVSAAKCAPTMPDPPPPVLSDVEAHKLPSEENPLQLTNAESQSQREDHGSCDPIKTSPISASSDIEESDEPEERSSAERFVTEQDSAYASPSVAVPKEPSCTSSSQGDASSTEEPSSDATLHKFFEPSTSEKFGSGDAGAVGKAAEHKRDADGGSGGGDESGEEEEQEDVEYYSDEDALPLLLSEEPVFEWKKRDFPDEKQMMVMPSHIDENAVIYVEILGEDIAKYKDMKAELNRVYSSQPPQPVRTVRRGQACIARYAADHMYYRAKVLGVGEAGIEVQFVDYGTIEYVSPDAVFTDLMFEDVPVLCLEVELYGLKPFSTTGSWPLKVLDTIHFTIVEHNCSMVVKERPTENTRGKVHFFLPDGVALHDFLLETGLACKEESCQPSKETTSSINGVTRQGSAEDEGDEEFPYQMFRPPEEGIFPVVVSNILSFNTVCIQLDKNANPSTPEEKLVNAMLDSFLAMMKVLPDVAPDFEPLTAPTVGMACCCQYSYDHSWYRALVRNVGQDEVTVLYVDYGNSESVPFSSLRILPDEYMDIPMQAVVCTLHGVTPVADTQEVIAAMVDVFREDGQEQFLARVKNSESDAVEIDILNSSLELVYQPVADMNLITINRNT